MCVSPVHTSEKMTASPNSISVTDIRRNDVLHKLAILTSLVILARFVIGEIINNYINIPYTEGSKISLHDTLSIITGYPLITVYGVLGTVLIIVSIAIVVVSTKFRSVQIRVVSYIGLAALLATAVFGLLYVRYAFADLYAVLTGAGTVLSLLIYFYLFHVTDKGIMMIQRTK